MYTLVNHDLQYDFVFLFLIYSSWNKNNVAFRNQYILLCCYTEKLIIIFEVELKKKKINYIRKACQMEASKYS